MYVRILIIMILAYAPPAAADALTRFFKEVKSYSARFEQVVVDEEGNVTQRSSGQLWIHRPNKFRWDYAAPYQQSIVGDGAKLWIHDVALEQVTVRALSDALGDTPAVLLAGTGSLSDSFIIQALPAAPGAALTWFTLQPKKKESGFEKIKLAFARNRLARLDLTDGFNQTTQITLSDYRENPRIDPFKFRFTPPAGTDVVEQ